MVGQDQEMMMMMRKGPWTEQEDVQLVLYVNLFGDRRWDSIAKVSGLKRTGKSCRLRWVNYLHPGLKRGKMTPHEERLVLELHAKWGNRWSRIARKLPGRTDNEIKNYWRTHTRKKAQERKRVVMSPSNSYSSSSSSSTTTTSNNPMVATMPVTETKERSFYDTGGVVVDQLAVAPRSGKKVEQKEEDGCSSMDEIWKDITTTLSSEDDSIMKLAVCEEACNFSGQPLMASPIWDYCPDWLWMMDEDESKMIVPKTDQFHFFNDQETLFLTG